MGEGPPGDAAAREQRAQLEHGGVGRQGDEAALARCGGLVERAIQGGLDGDAVGRHARVLQAQRELRRAGAAAGRTAHTRCEDLEVGVPDPGDVLPVRGAVVEDAQQVVLAGVQGQRPQDLVGARRVLHEQERQLAVAEEQRLRPAERRLDLLQAGRDVRQRGAEGQREAGRGERVVDVVETGQRDADVDRPLRRAQRDVGAAGAVEDDPRRRDREIGSARVAVRAVVATEVTEVDGVVDVRGATPAAVLGVRRVRHALQRDAVVVDAEVQDAVAVTTEVGDERIVRVEHERGPREPGDDRGPPVGDRLELAVAVELVAEEVGQQHRPGTQLGDDAVEPELVDLEEALVALCVHERGRHAAGHVRPGAVVDEPHAAAAEDRRDHRGRRRLPVRRADDRAAAGQARGQLADRARLHAKEQPAGQRRAAPPGAPGQHADAAGGCDLESEQRHGARTRRALGTARIVAGVIPTGSPSA